MKKVLLTVVLLSYSPSLPAQSTSADDQDVMVVMPSELDSPPSPTVEQRKHNAFMRKIRANLPYKDDLSKIGTSLGCLCKISDAIIVGKIAQIEVSDSDKFTRNVTIIVETNVSGRVYESTILAKVAWDLGFRQLNGGERGIFFLSERVVYLFDTREWSFDTVPVPDNVHGDLHLLGSDRSIIVVSSAEEEKAYLDAVFGYMRCLRGKTKDFEKYYQFLCGQMKSSYFRIKEDARRDMLDLIKSYPNIDLDRVLKDDNIDNGIKDYVRLILKPWKENKKVP